MDQFLLCSFLQTHNSRNPPDRDENDDTFSLLLFDLNQLSKSHYSLDIVELSENSSFIACLLIREFFGRPAYHVNVAPSNDCTNTCNRKASFVMGGHPSITGLHPDMKWGIFYICLSSC